MPVSPPPTTTTRLPSAEISCSGGDVAGLAALEAGDVAVALVEVVHRRSARRRARRPGRRGRAASREPMASTTASKLLAQLGGGHVAADVDAVARTRSPPRRARATRRSIIVLGSLTSGTPKRIRPPGPSSRSNTVTSWPAWLSSAATARPGRARADDGHAAARAPRRRLGDDPALLPGALGDRELDLLDRHRVGVDRQHAGRLARRRADRAGELGEVVRQVQLVDRLAPAAAVDEVVPVGDQVAERAALVAERHAAVHAARALLAQDLVGLQVEVALVVVRRARPGRAWRSRPGGA